METILNKEDFFKEYPTAAENFEKANIEWNVLEDIYSDYLLIQEDLKTAATYSINILLNLPKVHSVRSRVKDAKHLVEKIIRKRSEVENFDVTVENYKAVIHDLIGLRAMHLFKTDWEQIHDGIQSKWNIHGNPVANFREGDSEEFKAALQAKGCDLKKHKYGYRSTHYIVEVPVGKQVFYAEIQVRTIYEEAWSEIDHTVRYPYFLDNPMIRDFSMISNRLSGMADEMGTFIKVLSDDIIRNNKEKENYEASIKKLENTISQLKIDETSKSKINKELGDVLKKESFNTYVGTSVHSAISSLDFGTFTNLAELSRKAQSAIDRTTLSNLSELSRVSQAAIDRSVLSNLAEISRVSESASANSRFSSLAELSNTARVVSNTSGIVAAAEMARTIKSIPQKSSIMAAVDMVKEAKSKKADSGVNVVEKKVATTNKKKGNAPPKKSASKKTKTPSKK